MEPRAAGTWNLLLGTTGCVKGNSHGPKGEQPAEQDGAGRANADQEGKLQSYSPS